MSFDPRIISAEDAPLDDDGSLLLPADLSELASQLRDDANYLATLYPAKPAPQIARSVAGQARFPRSIMFAAASLLLLVGGGWIWLSRFDLREPTSRLVTVPLVQPTEVSQVNQESSVENGASFPISFEQPHVEGLLLYEYSGPELEGVYDLLAESPQQEISF